MAKNKERAPKNNAKSGVGRYEAWRETVVDRTIIAGEGGIVVGKKSLGNLVKTEIAKDKTSPSPKDLEEMKAYGELRKAHNEEYHFQYGSPAPKKLTDALFDEEHGTGSAKRVAEVSDTYYRRLHQIRLSILDKAVKEKTQVIVNGIKFFPESGKWVTAEPTAPPTLQSKGVRLASGSLSKEKSSKEKMYPANAQGLIKLAQETSPEFLTLIINKTKEREQAVKDAPKIAPGVEKGELRKIGLKRPLERDYTKRMSKDGRDGQ
jgi:hypothetical protein